MELGTKSVLSETSAQSEKSGKLIKTVHLERMPLPVESYFKLHCLLSVCGTMPTTEDLVSYKIILAGSLPLFVYGILWSVLCGLNLGGGADKKESGSLLGPSNGRQSPYQEKKKVWIYTLLPFLFPQQTSGE